MANSNEQLSTKLAQQGAQMKPSGFKDYGAQWFKKNEKSLATLMGTEKEAKRLFLTGLHVASTNPKLLECTPTSFFAALLRCAELKLYPGPLQEAAIVPFRNSKKGITEAQFMPQYQGLIKLAMNTGHIKGITANVVHQHDVFEYEFGTNAFLRHRPLLNGRGAMMAAYAHVRLGVDAEQFLVMSEEEVYKIRGRSKMWQSDQKYKSQISVWSQPDLEHWMWRKTAIKQLLKLLPKSPDLAAAMEADDEAETGEARTAVVDLIGGVDFESKEQDAEQSEPIADSGAAPK